MSSDSPGHVAGIPWGAGGVGVAKRGAPGGAAAVRGLWKRPLTRPGGGTRRVGRALLPVLPALLRSRRGRLLLLRGSVARPERVPPDAAARLVRSYITSPGFDGANNAMRAEVFSGVEDIRVPVTLAWGEHDRLVARPQTKVPDWRAVTLHGCGHIPTWDDRPSARLRLLASACC